MSSRVLGQYMIPPFYIEPTVPAHTSDCSSSEATIVAYSRFASLEKPKARGKTVSVAHSVSSEALECKLHHISMMLLHSGEGIIGFIFQIYEKLISLWISYGTV